MVRSGSRIGSSLARVVALLSAIVLGAGGCAAFAPAPPTASLSPPGRSHPATGVRPCVVAERTARCGALEVPEDRRPGAPSTRSIFINFKVIPATGPQPAPDPIFWLAGGPGGAATVYAESTLAQLAEANRRRDLVFVDQRGTGGSNELRCKHGTDASAWATELSDCLAHLDADPAAYTTAWAMDDLDAVRAYLGYDTINLYGGSYGATAAEVFLQRHPDHVRTVMMVGGSLLGVPLFERYPESSERALDEVFARCAADAACAAAYPDLRADLRAVIARLDAGPVELPIPHPQNWGKIFVDRNDFGPGLHNLLRDTRTVGLVPRLLHSAAQGDWGPVSEVVARSLVPWPADPPVEVEPSWQVMNLTIVCNEPWAQLRPGPTIEAASRSYLRLEDVQALRAAPGLCEEVPGPVPEAIYATPVRLDVPMLLVNGGLDPQDPAGNVTEAASRYPNSLVLSAPSQSHVFINGPCLGTILAAFVDIGATGHLPTACLSADPGPVFATG